MEYQDSIKEQEQALMGALRDYMKKNSSLINNGSPIGALLGDIEEMEKKGYLADFVESHAVERGMIYRTVHYDEKGHPDAAINLYWDPNKRQLEADWEDIYQDIEVFRRL